MSIGQTLAEARLAAGLTITEVSAHTRIRGALIRAIEADDFGPCGGDFYARGHIRAIARVVGVDSRPLIAEYDAAHQEDPPGALDDLLAYPPAGREQAPPPARREQAPPPRPRRARDPDLARAPGPWLARLGELQPPEWLRELRPPALPRPREFRLPRLPRHVALLALTALAVIGGGAYQLAAGFGAPRAGTGTAAPRPAASAPPPTARTPAGNTPPPTAITVRQVKPSDVTATGPGGGDGDNPDLAAKALGGDPSSPWHTHWYTTAAFGNLKPGTGLTLVLPRTIRAAGVTVKFGDSGGAMQVKAGTSPGSLRTVASSGSAGGTTRLSFSETSARYVELWFTRLGTDNGAYQISVYDVSVSAVRAS